MDGSEQLNSKSFLYLGLVQTIRKVSSNTFVIERHQLYLTEFNSKYLYRLHIEDKDEDYHVILGEYKCGGGLYNAQAGEYFFNVQPLV